MHTSLCLPACFASATLPRMYLFPTNLTHLYSRVSSLNNASCQPKIKKRTPMVAGSDAHAKRTAFGGASGEDGAPIDRGLHGCCCCCW